MAKVAKDKQRAFCVSPLFALSGQYRWWWEIQAVLWVITGSLATDKHGQRKKDPLMQQLPLKKGTFMMWQNTVLLTRGSSTYLLLSFTGAHMSYEKVTEDTVETKEFSQSRNILSLCLRQTITQEGTHSKVCHWIHELQTGIYLILNNSIKPVKWFVSLCLSLQAGLLKT